MKAYEAKYIDRDDEYYSYITEYVIAENEAFAKTFLDERLGFNSNCASVTFKETSFEEVKVKDLTAGDLMRLLNCH